MKIFKKIIFGLLIAMTANGASALDLPIKEINGRQYYYYAVERGETVLSIAKDLGITRDDIIKYNPRAADGVRQGTTIYLPVNEYVNVKSPKKVVKNKAAEVKPKAEKKEAPRTIFIEAEDKDTECSLPQEPSTEPNGFAEELLTDSATSDSSYEEYHRPSIALMLPLMLNDTTETKASRSTTEFVRGFMIGVNEMSNSEVEADIYIFDTEDNPERAAEIMEEEVMNGVDVLIAPDNTASLHAVAEAFNSPDGYILNMFAVQDSTHFDNPQVIQSNVHNTVMYQKATDALMDNYSDYTPVFLLSKNGRNEKANFTNYVRTRYAEAGLPTIDMSFNAILTSVDFEQLDSTARYVFIPSSGSLTEFNKFSRALIAHRENRLDPSSIALFGYPDWLTFRNEAYDHLHRLDATIYSRFYANAEWGADEFAYDYQSFYGSEMPLQVPSQALLGYDTARHIFMALDADGYFDPTATSEGVQSSFRCTGDNDQMAGYSNQSVYIIHFHQGQDVSVEIR